MMITRYRPLEKARFRMTRVEKRIWSSDIVAGRAGAGHVHTLMFDAIIVTVLSITLLTLYIEAFWESYYGAAAQSILLANGILALYGLVMSTRRGYTLFTTTFYFCFVFMTIAPLQQYPFLFRSIFVDDEATAVAAALCLMFTGVGIGALWLRIGLPKRSALGSWGLSLVPSFQSVSSVRLIFAFAVVMPVSAVLLFLYRGHLFTSRQEFGNFFNSLFSRELGIIVTAFVHPFVLISAALGFFLALKGRSMAIKIMFGLLLVSALAIYSPLVTARFRLSAMLVFVLLIVVGWYRTRVLLTFLLVGTLLSPLFNQFRYSSQLEENRNLGNFMVHLDYDVFSFVAYTVRYVINNGVDHGRSAFSAFAFFVPRSIWADKSEHVPKLMFPYLRSETGLVIDNLSSPPIMEGYFAFGVVGSIGAAIMFFWLVLTLERQASVAEPFSPAVLLMSLAPMYVVILLRGPLVVGVSEFSGAAIMLTVALWLLGAFRHRSWRTRTKATIIKNDQLKLRW